MMNSTNRETRKAVVLWLSGIRWEVEYKVISPSALVSCVRSCARSAFSSATCLIVKCLVEARPLEPAVTEAISEALRIAHAWVGETGLLGLLSDFQPAAVEC